VHYLIMHITFSDKADAAAVVKSAIAAPSRMAPNAAQLGKREVSDGSLDHCAWARSRAALSAALWCRLQWRYSAAHSAIAVWILDTNAPKPVAGQSQAG
jgi:hypothetical protein